MPRGLTTFIASSSTCLQSYELRDTRVVLDGKWLAHWFFYNLGVDFKHGGDYKKYADEITRFFKSFQLCNVTPYVLLDGTDYLDDKKMTTLMDRAQKKVQDSYNITVLGGEGRLRPMLAMHVFTQVLHQLKINIAVCDFEADNEIVDLANAFSCPVIGEDSDFYVFDIKGGFIPMKNLKWEEASAENRKSMRCELYKLQEFCNEFKLKKDMMPILSILVGNDFIPREVFDSLYHGKIKRQVNIPQGEGVRVKRTVAWLAKQRSVPQVETLMKRSLNYDEPDIEPRMKESGEFYCSTKPPKLEKYFENEANLIDIQGCPLPGWALKLYRQGYLQPSAVNIKYQRKTFISACVEDVSQPSCSNVSLPIRQVTYGILLQSDGGAEEGAIEEGAFPHPHNSIIEIDRRDGRQDMSRRKITAMDELENYGQLPSLLQVESLDEAERKRLIMEVLDVKNVDIESLPENLQLPVAIAMYWKKKSTPEVSQHILNVVLLGMVVGRCGDETTEEEVEKLDPPPSRMNLELVQALAQWQSSLYYGLQLNAVLNQPYPMPDVLQLYNGTLLHSLHATTEGTSDVDIEWARENLLNSNGPAQQLFVQLTTLPW